VKDNHLKLKIFLPFLIFFLFLAKSVFAVCPLCTVAVVGGLEISRILGVDDLVSSIWIGGLIISLGFWLSDFLAKKNFLKPIWREVLSLALFYLLTIPFLFWGRMINVAGNVFWGIDKVILGIIIGSIIFVFGVLTDKFLRKINHGEVFIYYQKVLVPVLFLTFVSLIFYLLTSNI